MRTDRTPTLYTLDSQGKVRCWHGYIEENEDGTAVLGNLAGLEGGKQTGIPITITKGKNIGRKNETTPYEQAYKEMMAKFNKKLEENYVLDLSDFRKSGVMTAHNADKYLDKLPDIIQAQPKLDGIRCKFRKKEEGFELRSKTDREFPSFLKDTSWAIYLDSVTEPGDEVDGEIYVHGLALPEIGALTKRERMNTETFRNHCIQTDEGVLVNLKRAEVLKQMFYGDYELEDIEASSERVKEGTLLRDIELEAIYTLGTDTLEFWAFDLPDHDETPTEIRLDGLTALLSDAEDHNIKVVEYTEIRKDQVEQLNTNYTARGFEGVMLRNPAGPYEYGERSYHLQKYKSFIDEEFEIIGFEKDRQGFLNIVFLSEAGKPFPVRPKGTREWRRKLLLDADDLIGQKATVRYQALLPNSLIPQFARVIAIRDYE